MREEMIYNIGELVYIEHDETVGTIKNIAQRDNVWKLDQMYLIEYHRSFLGFQIKKEEWKTCQQIARLAINN